jgi:hypothetical protein
VVDGVKALYRAAADSLGRRIGRDECGVLALEGLQLVQQRIEFGVADLRRVVDVVLLFVVTDQIAKRRDA